MAIKIFADGTLAHGTTCMTARINGTSPRELVLASAGIRVDVTHVWHSKQLPAIVASILEKGMLPDGFIYHTRADGVRGVGVEPA